MSFVFHCSLWNTLWYFTTAAMYFKLLNWNVFLFCISIWIDRHCHLKWTPAAAVFYKTVVYIVLSDHSSIINWVFTSCGNKSPIIIPIVGCPYLTWTWKESLKPRRGSSGSAGGGGGGAACGACFCELPCMEKLPFWVAIEVWVARKVQVWLWGVGNVI